MTAKLTDSQVEGYVAHARLMVDELQGHSEEDAVAIASLAIVIKMRQYIMRKAQGTAKTDPILSLLDSMGHGLRASDWDNPAVKAALNQATIIEIVKTIPLMAKVLEVVMLKEGKDAQRNG